MRMLATSWFVNRSSVNFLAALGMLALATSRVVAAPLSYTGGEYTQNFDTLPTTGSVTVTGRGPFYINNSWFTGTGVTGWQFANPTGSSGNTEVRAQNGSQSGSAGRGTLSVGSTSSSDRALGALATSNQIPVFGLVLVNNSGDFLDKLTLEYTGEQWRRGDVSPGNKLAFSWGLASGIDASLTAFSALDFNSPNTQITPTEVALDGNLTANKSVITATINDINWAPGTTLVLKWTGQDISGQDDLLAIDNLKFTAVPEPSTLAIALVGALGLVGRLARRRRS